MSRIQLDIVDNNNSNNSTNDKNYDADDECVASPTSVASPIMPTPGGYTSVTKKEYKVLHTDKHIVATSEVNRAKSWVGASIEARQKLYRESIEHNDAFWARIAREDYHWHKLWADDAHVKSYNFHRSKGPVYVRWFDGAMTNVCYNALDRHLPHHANRVCFYAEGNFVHQTRTITYGEMYREVVQVANVLKTQYGVRKGDRVSVYLPMVPFAAAVMLACARLGAVVSVIFAGYSSQALVTRLQDAKPAVLVTADASFRGEKPILLKKIADEALDACAAAGLHIPCLVYENCARQHCGVVDGRDTWYGDAVARLTREEREHCAIEWVDAEDALFMLYTSGSTGKPKALIHTTAGYMVYAGTTFKYTFDYHADEDVYFCTADVGWITGHSYVVYGPMLHAATSVLYEGVPTFPTASRWWEMVARYRVTIFYTAPTAIRSLMTLGDEAVQKCDRSTLRILGSVGEPINVEAWTWFHEVVGGGRADVVDTWWQTETGGHMITPLPGCTPLKPGSASLPFFGVVPVLLDTLKLTPLDHDAVANGNGNHAAAAAATATTTTTAGDEDVVEDKAVGEGLLAMARPWPGMARTIHGDHARFEQTYFAVDGYYITGDGARRDTDGYLWITGRVDDVLNVSGHRIGTSEVEDAVNSHHAVVESAVVGVPHEVKGESIYVFVTFHRDTDVTEELLRQVRSTVRHVIGPLATPDHVQPAQAGLPKTRSGKIVRRVLRKIAAHRDDDLGDISTLADPAVVPALLAERARWTSAHNGSRM